MEKYYMAAMGGADGFGNRSIEKLIKFFGSAEAGWSADIDDLILAGIQPKSLEAFIAFRGKHPNAPENLVRYCERHNFSLCSISDEDYPPILKEIFRRRCFSIIAEKFSRTRRGLVSSARGTTRLMGKALRLNWAKNLRRRA